MRNGQNSLGFKKIQSLDRSRPAHQRKVGRAGKGVKLLARGAQQLAERISAFEDSEAQKNQANENLAMISARMDELEEKVVVQEKNLAQARAM